MEEAVHALQLHVAALAFSPPRLLSPYARRR